MLIQQVIDLLKLYNYYGISENVDIAKGVNKLDVSLKDMFKQEIRKAKWQKRK